MAGWMESVNSFPHPGALVSVQLRTDDVVPSVLQIQSFRSARSQSQNLVLPAD